MATTVKHPDRLAEQVNNILRNPESWCQAAYHTACGAKHCIAGHGQIAAGKPMRGNTCRADAREWYGLTSEDADWLFRHDCTLTELYNFAMAAIAGEPYFDSGGFGHNGFDRDGFGRNGFDRSGFDRNGFDRGGFDRDGYDRNGFKRDGFKRDGFDCDGLDRDGDSLPLLKITGDK